MSILTNGVLIASCSNLIFLDIGVSRLEEICTAQREHLRRYEYTPTFPHGYLKSRAEVSNAWVVTQKFRRDFTVMIVASTCQQSGESESVAYVPVKIMSFCRVHRYQVVLGLITH